uniref:DUF4801 domain-containing protein n=1 Tax=Ascaris lumbricoides TaxID=6252 RepID=A0A0M3I950_ASCLU
MISARGTGSSKHDNELLVKKDGCSIPLQSGCLKGECSSATGMSCLSVPPPQSTNEGIKMECNNANCPFKEELMHVECFEAFENNLIKIMSSIDSLFEASAEQKAMCSFFLLSSLRRKLSRSRAFNAGREQLAKFLLTSLSGSRLGSARGWTNAQRRANLWDKKGLSLIQKFCRCACGMGLLRLDQAEKGAATLTPRIPKTKKAKGKNLPTLNYSGSSTALLAGDEQSEKHENSCEYLRLKEDPHRISRMSRQTSENDSGACIESLIDARVSISAGDGDMSTCSLVSDISTGGSPEREQRPGTNEAEVDIASILLSPPETPPLCPEVAEVSRGLTYCTNEAEVDIASILLSPPETPPLCPEVAEARSEPHSEMSSDVNESYYKLFAGKSFYLGEMLLAEIHLPGALHIGIDMGHTAKGRPSFMK